MEVRIIYSWEHPLASEHLILEKDFKKLCEERGYSITDISYHHNFQKESIYSLQNNPSPVSLSIRLTPDLIVSKDGDTKFYELKTGRAKDIMRLEAYQLMCNQIREIYFHAPCIYVYSGAFSNGQIIACHAKDIRPETLIIPDVEKNRQIKPIIENFYTCEKKTKKIKPQFSGDAYIEISNKENWVPIDNFIK